MVACEEGISARWSRSRSAANGGAWRAGARNGVPHDFDRLRTAARGGPGGFVANDGAYMARREVRNARGTGRRARLGFCQAVRGLAIMPNLLSFAKLSKIQTTPNAKMLDTLFTIFGKLQKYKSQIQNCWRCS